MKCAECDNQAINNQVQLCIKCFAKACNEFDAEKIKELDKMVKKQKRKK